MPSSSPSPSSSSMSISSDDVQNNNTSLRSSSSDGSSSNKEILTSNTNTTTSSTSRSSSRLIVASNKNNNNNKNKNNINNADSETTTSNNSGSDAGASTNSGSTNSGSSSTPTSSSDIHIINVTTNISSSSGGGKLLKQRFSCRARGMPLDHNIKSAYLVIPETAQHGDELHCSYTACREQGVKFCYCSYCRAPVAKRNFRIRHHHFGEQKAAQQQGQETMMQEDEAGETEKESTDSYSDEEGTAAGLPAVAASRERSGLPASLLQQQAAAINPSQLLSQLQSLTNGLQLPTPTQDITTMLLSQILGNTLETPATNSVLENTVGMFRPGVAGDSSLAVAKAPLASAGDPNHDSSRILKRAAAATTTTNKGSFSKNDKGKLRPITGRLAFQMKIPCPARGMPEGHHRLEDAHFVIPKDAEHGDDLICSFPACRDAGVKFCFCLYCRISVSKRNFRRLHHHRDRISEEEKPSSTAGATTTTTTTAFTGSDRLPKKKRAFQAISFDDAFGSSPMCLEVTPSSKKSAQVMKDEASKQAASVFPSNTSTTAATLTTKDSPRPVSDDSGDRPSMPRTSSTSTSEKDNSMEDEEGDDSSDSDNNRISMTTTDMPDREQLWAQLLVERPSDTEGKEMMEWLEKVVAMSEPSAGDAACLEEAQ